MFQVIAAIAVLCMPGFAMEAKPPQRLVVTVGKSLSVDSPVTIRRVAIANTNLAETVMIGPREMLINGLAPGETSLVIWQEGDVRLVYDLLVRPSSLKLDAVRDEISTEFPDDRVELTVANEFVFVRGTVKTMAEGDRVVAIASTIGKTVNLLRVAVPPEEPQILLRVRFADVERGAASQLASGLASGALNTTAALGTGAPLSTDGAQTFSLSNAINLFLFRRDLNLGLALQALQTKSLLEMLAEPNLLVINGTAAHFVAGGEFPYPMVQPGGGSNSVSIAFKDYGIKLGFLPVITPRGTIRMQVTPEVSALDYTNSVTIAGTTVPGTSLRRVDTEVELDSGQSFVIAGLLNNQTTENLSKVPGIGDIPILGKLFQSKSVSRNHTELLVIITPEIVRPIPADKPVPALSFAFPQLKPGSVNVYQPGIDQTGPVPVTPPTESLPMEVLIKQQLEQKKLKLQQPSNGTSSTPIAPAAGGLPNGQ
ncbi:MAG TPA: pilus assembly protein N-terminal domain-containing protein [Bryobacteraceae bacterium]|nr:pilus assembly protein N-terminal domain-containing protein [Bryobacteraceae bacterium]